MFDYCLTLAEDLRSIMQATFIPVKLYTDRKSQCDVIYKGTKTAEKRLRLDIAVVKEGFQKGKSFVSSEATIMLLMD